MANARKPQARPVTPDTRLHDVLTRFVESGPDGFRRHLRFKDAIEKAFPEVFPEPAVAKRQMKPLRVGDHYLEIDDGGLYYMTVLKGPNAKGEYTYREECEREDLGRPWREPIPGAAPLTEAQWAQCAAAGFPESVSGFLAALSTAPSSPEPAEEPNTPETPRDSKPAFVTVQIPERLLSACLDEGASIAVIVVKGSVDWEPQGANGKILAYDNQCGSCNGSHEILHAPACFCPWCGAEIEVEERLTGSELTWV